MYSKPYRIFPSSSNLKAESKGSFHYKALISGNFDWMLRTFLISWSTLGMVFCNVLSAALVCQNSSVSDKSYHCSAYNDDDGHNLTLVS